MFLIQKIFSTIERAVKREWVNLLTVALIASLLPLNVLGEPGERPYPPPVPSFDIVFPTIGGHRADEGRAGCVHGETWHVPPHEIPNTFRRLMPILPKVPAGEPLEMAFYLGS